MQFAKKLLAGGLAAGVITAAGVVGASVSGPIEISGSDDVAAASLSCPGGMTRLGHPFDENMSIFPGDPAVHVRNLYTVAVDFFKVEDIDMGAHAGTHIDVPAHFIDENDEMEPGRTLDQLEAEEFVWPVYKIDVQGVPFTDNFVQIADIEAYVLANGDIPEGALVVLQTGAEEFFGLDGADDEFGTEKYKDMATKEKFELSANTDDLFDFENAGFSGQAVQHLVDTYGIAGVGSDAYGPDAFGDDLFDATYTILANDGVAVVALANLDSVNVTGDIMMAPAVNLTNGSGFPVDPIACHGSLAAES